MTQNVPIAFLFTLIAGLSTGIGSLTAFLAKRTNRKFLSVSLGFSAGVMIYISMIEIFFQAQESLIKEMGEKAGSWVTVLSFFCGMFVIAFIDRMIPCESNLIHHTCEESFSSRLLRMGLFTALALAIHNFPEGLATFVSALQNPEMAVPVVAAIAIHNIPEGIAVSVPVYQATGSRKKAFWFSFLSGLAEPAGALIGWFLLKPIMSEWVLGMVFAGVAGIMVFISFDELLPTANEYGEHKLSLWGLIGGMGIMAVSLLLFL